MTNATGSPILRLWRLENQVFFFLLWPNSAPKLYWSSIRGGSASCWLWLWTPTNIEFNSTGYLVHFMSVLHGSKRLGGNGVAGEEESQWLLLPGFTCLSCNAALSFDCNFVARTAWWHTNTVSTWMTGGGWCGHSYEEIHVELEVMKGWF